MTYEEKYNTVREKKGGKGEGREREEGKRKEVSYLGASLPNTPEREIMFLLPKNRISLRGERVAMCSKALLFKV